jgi:phosphatidylserine/phosphatidylglycerophosphate/cardiolipin synthase-like enzyme
MSDAARSGRELPEFCEDLGHRFRWIHTGTAAFDTIVAMIDAARLCVDFEFYTVAPGAESDRIGEALRRAASIIATIVSNAAVPV